jgi:preprotein translocase subunit SecG
MLYSILIVAQVIISIMLITLVLLQQGKGADAGAAFGSGASSTVFGSRGSANFLSRSTGILATLFFFNSLGMAYMISNRPAEQSVVDQAVIEETIEVQETVQEQDVPVIDVPVEEEQPATTSTPADVPE